MAVAGSGSCFSRMYINSLPTAPQALCEECEVADRGRLDRDTVWETEGSEFSPTDNRIKLETEVVSAYSVLLTICILFYAVVLI